MTEPDPGNYAWWLAARAAGVVAFLLIASAVILGLYLSSGALKRPGMKRDLVKIHQQIALTALAAIGAHGLFMLGDGWLKPGITGITVPFTLGYRPLWTGLGILAGYMAALLGPSFYFRRRIGARRWRRIHQATVVVYALAVLHSFGSGTDAGSVWFTVIVIATAIPIVVLLGMRYGRRRKRPAPAAPVRPPAPAGPSAKRPRARGEAVGAPGST